MGLTYLLSFSNSGDYNVLTILKWVFTRNINRFDFAKDGELSSYTSPISSLRFKLLLIIPFYYLSSSSISSRQGIENVTLVKWCRFRVCDFTQQT